jgi:hypothetical protein
MLLSASLLQMLNEGCLHSSMLFKSNYQIFTTKSSSAQSVVAA